MVENPSGPPIASRPPTPTVDVTVIGAGLAGLACATRLVRHGLSVSVLEASDEVGGRMRTDRHHGFLLDRGFQVFNTSYPQVRALLDLRALRLRPFTPGLLLHTAQGRIRFADPSRRPGQCADLVNGRLAGVRDLAALGALSARDMLVPARAVRSGARESDTREALARAGFSDAFVERMWRPFLSGIFLEESLETSSRFFHLVWRSMLRGTLCLPNGGIGAVPQQLADRLPAGTVRTGVPVAGLIDGGAVTTEGDRVTSRATVVATDPQAAARLLPGLAVPGTRSVTTFHHALPRSPLGEPTLLVDTEREVLHTAVLTDVAPGYSDNGRALVSTSVLGRAGDADEPRVRARAGEMYGCGTGDWEYLGARPVPHALPAMPAPLVLGRTTRQGPGRYVCGDHRATGSVQGALASGTRAAREVLADLRR